MLYKRHCTCNGALFLLQQLIRYHPPRPTQPDTNSKLFFTLNFTYTYQLIDHSE